ncbi:MAG: DeoR family transcriptional regulator [Rhodospirillaceae bacterium]|nr:MAG: DeoR family transcriptional regulator [Rhodospirillaceae bacterium]
MEARRNEVLEMVARQGYVSIEEIARHFKVTLQTIRRDINELAGLGLLQRHHGGASLPSSVENVAYDRRQILHRDEKKALANTLAEHIPDNASLFINIGTTTEAVASALLLNHKGLRIITNNLNVANMLSDKEDFEVMVTGGVVRCRDKGLTGEAALNMIGQFRVDYGIIGISAIDTDGTLLDYDYREVQVAKAILANSRKVLLAADQSKVGRNAMVRLGHLNDIHSWYTDKMPKQPLLGVVEQADMQIHVAKSASFES